MFYISLDLIISVNLADRIHRQQQHLQKQYLQQQDLQQYHYNRKRDNNSNTRFGSVVGHIILG